MLPSTGEGGEKTHFDSHNISAKNAQLFFSFTQMREYSAYQKVLMCSYVNTREQVGLIGTLLVACNVTARV